MTLECFEDASSTTLVWKVERCWCLQARLDLVDMKTKAAFEFQSFCSREVDSSEGSLRTKLMRLLVPYALPFSMSYIAKHKRLNPKAEKKPAWHEYNRALLEPRPETYFLTFFFSILFSSFFCFHHRRFVAYISRSPSNWMLQQKKKQRLHKVFFTVNQSYVMKASPFCVSVLLSELEKRTK